MEQKNRYTRKNIILFASSVILIIVLIVTSVVVFTTKGSEKENDKSELSPSKMTTYEPYTHFLSIPLNLNGLLTTEYTKFQTATGLTSKLFVATPQLHLTLEMLRLTEKSDIELVKRAIQPLLTSIPKTIQFSNLQLSAIILKEFLVD